MIAIAFRLIRDRLVLLVGAAPPRVAGRVVRCPRCSSPSGFERA